MARIAYERLYVENIGPVRKANIVFNDLTVFIGPNNTGKTYVSMIYYGFRKTLLQIMARITLIGSISLSVSNRGAAELPLTSLLFSAVGPQDVYAGVSSELRSAALRVIREAVKKYIYGKPRENIDSIVNSIVNYILDKNRELFTKIWMNTGQGIKLLLQRHDIASATKQELRRIFYTDKLQDIISGGEKRGRIAYSLSNEKLELTMTLIINRGKKPILKIKATPRERFSREINTIKKHYAAAVRNTLMDIYSRGMRSHRSQGQGGDYEKIASFLLDLLMTVMHIRRLTLLRDLIAYDKIYYFPASRAGIIQTYRTVTPVLAYISSIIGIDEVHIPRMPGVAADFISVLTSVKPAPGKPPQIVSWFEENVIEGKIELRHMAHEKPPLLVYRPRRGKSSIPLVRASSMVTELALIDVILKYTPIDGSVFIIEEPESHLHPDKEIKATGFIAMLTNRHRSRIIITTHSDIVLTTLSILLLSSRTQPDKELEKLGLTEDMYLEPGKVAVYLFARDEKTGLTNVSRVSVEEGISYEEFDKIITMLYDKHTDLFYRYKYTAAKRR